jgi:uncharacterized protein YndB with AHSA1/START domain
MIAATPEFLFDTWTQPAKMKEWWGPRDVKCVAVEIDLRVGGRYRIGNQFPDDRILWISGEFESIERPHRLVYTWSVEPVSGSIERVSVQFEPRDGATEVIVTHERIPDAATRDQHQAGWHGCLDGLVSYASRENY